jgi:protoheme IX farnesyltransferase
MKAAVLSHEVAAELTHSRLADYVALTKPRISVLVLFTVGAGAFLAAGSALDVLVLLHAVVGTAFVASGASALNQFIERHSDNLMRRTESRPLPAGRLQPMEVLLFGSALAVVGLLYLVVSLKQFAAPLVAAVTFIAYVFIYTPLKRKTSLNTLIGAVPGALPPVIGWAAVKGTLDEPAWILFGIVFLWQVPHFLAIAWIYREDYSRAGLQMLPCLDPDGRLTSRQMTLYTLTLIAVSFLPAWINIAGPVYLLGALALGLFFLARTSDFARSCSTEDARRVLRASLVYLPCLLALLLLDRLYGPLALHP